MAHKKVMNLRSVLIFLVALLFPAVSIYADGKVSVILTGLEDGDCVSVTISSSEYLASLKVTESGKLEFQNVPEGTHFVKAEANGYETGVAQKVIVDANGNVIPQEPLKIAITKQSDDPNKWNFSWTEDESVGGYTTTTNVNQPVEIEFLGKKIVPSDVSSSGVLLNTYNIILSDEEELWTQEYAYRMVETFKTLPVDYSSITPSKFILSAEHIADDISVDNQGEGCVVKISKDAFCFANPFLVNLDGVRGRLFSKRLHHALTNFITDFGRDEGRVDQILWQRFGCHILDVDYENLTAGITNEDAACFQKFEPAELVSIINMYEELPEGFHKIPHLNYLIRRQNGHKHPLYPEAAAVAWPVDNGYIEFMENAFGGNAQNFETLRLILHEKTHFLWAFTFSEEIKKDWIEIGGWYRDPNASDEPDLQWSTTKDVEFVSAYAHAKNPNEDMAESVAFYLKDPEALQARSINKFNFIRDRIMHGTRYISSIPDYLTFEVLNLWPDYDYPGKIKSVNIEVTGAPEEDKVVKMDIELFDMEGYQDEASGAYTRITSPTFYDKKGDKYSQFVDISLSPVDGDGHHLYGEVSIGKYSKKGHWTFGDIITTDLQGNERYEGRNDCVTDLYVNNPLEDVEPAEYESGSLEYEVTKTMVDGHPCQNLKVTYKVADNIGISKTTARIYADVEGFNTGGTDLTDQYGTYDENTHTAEINFIIPEFYPSGNYYISQITFYDAAGTEKWIPFSESPLHEPVKKIYIETTNPDTEAPEIDLNRIVVYAEPTHPEAPDGETLVTINFYARDNISGFGPCYYHFRDPQGVLHGNYWFYHENFGGLFYDGDPTAWSNYKITHILPQGSAPGIWGLGQMYVADHACNERYYNFVETLIFEPDDSDTDYVLFANLDDNDMLNLSLTSETLNGYGYTYRIISDENGQELNGSLTAEQRAKTRSAAHYDKSVDISSLPDGKIIVIINVVDADNKVMAVRSQSLVKSSSPTGIESRIDKTNGNVTSITYYDAMGRKLNAPSKGLNIVKVMYENGTVKTMKVNSAD